MSLRSLLRSEERKLNKSAKVLARRAAILADYADGMGVDISSCTSLTEAFEMIEPYLRDNHDEDEITTMRLRMTGKSGIKRDYGFMKELERI